CHRAGADLPAALIRSAAGLADQPDLLDYAVGVITVRREEFTVLRSDDTTYPTAQTSTFVWKEEILSCTAPLATLCRQKLKLSSWRILPRPMEQGIVVLGNWHVD